MNTYLLTYKTKVSLKDRLLKIAGLGRRRRRTISNILKGYDSKQYFRIPKETNTIQYFY